MIEENKEKSSGFNEAVQKIGRVARLQEEANQCAKMGDWNGWYGNITIVFLEISSKLSDKDVIKIQKEILKCNQSLIAYNNLSNARYQGLRVSTISATKNNIYSLLFQLDFNMRSLIDKSGYGSPNKEDDLF